MVEEGVGRRGGGQSNSFSGGKKVPCNLHPHGDDLGVSVGLLVKIVTCDDLVDEMDKNEITSQSNNPKDRKVMMRRRRRCVR